MIGNFDFQSDNLMSAAFYLGFGFTWLLFTAKRLSMEGWND